MGFFSIFHKRKLRVDILTIFFAIFVLSISFIILYSYQRSSEAVLKLGESLIEEANQNIIIKLDEYLVPQALVNSVDFIMTDGVMTPDDLASLNTVMDIILKSYPQLLNIHVADLTGTVYLENRYEDTPFFRHFIPFLEGHNPPANTAFLTQIVINKNHFSNVEYIYKDKFGKSLLKENGTANYDPRTSPWYVGAKNSSNRHWTGIYEFFGTKKHGITISFPIFEDNQFVGVGAEDISLDQINHELKKRSLSAHGDIYIINNDQKIIGYEKEFSNDIYALKDVDDPELQKAYAIYQETKQNRFTFALNGASFIAHFTPYSVSPSEKWEIVTILPVDFFVGNLKRANHMIVFFSFIMLLIGMILIYYFSHKISKPIMRLARETRDMIKLKFDRKTTIQTPIYEVQVMAEALNAARSALFSFAKYVPKTLVEQLLRSGFVAEVGGEKKQITVLFSDIANFTQIAEATNPEKLMVHISAYLNALTKIIQQNQGNIDKYIGDAIMAFWGTPLTDKEHSLHACRAALACQREVDRLNNQWQADGKPVFKTRFGMDTGNAIVGNMGSADRLNYTAIGDTVNTASRLEKLGKDYNVDIIVSQYVYDHCDSQFLFRPLDHLLIRGKQKPMTIYQLVAVKNTATADQITLCELSTKAFHAYFNKQFAEAADIFKKIQETFPRDGMAEIYLKRIRS